MTKEEKIKEAWYTLMPDYTNIDLSNGWSLGTFNYKEIEYTLFDVIVTKIGYFIRPKSLEGIENNNGWIKIESKDDLPKDDIVYWVVQNGEVVDMENWELTLNFYSKRGVTHYQPIEKPKPPIF